MADNGHEIGSHSDSHPGTMPDEEIIKRFKELGGKYITIGSDAHRWGDVGAGIEDGMRVLLKCGFTHFTVYEKRKPKLLPIL